MEGGKSVRVVAVIAVLVLLCAGHASASYGQCYNDCYSRCTEKIHDASICVVKCLFQCIKADKISGGQGSCDAGCAVKQCSPFGSDSAKVITCADACGNGKC